SHSPMPGIVLTSCWSANRREIGLRATIGLSPPRGDTVARVPDSTLQLLKQLGAIRTEELQVFLEPDEDVAIDRAGRNAEALSRKWHAASRDMLRDLPLPHDLPDDPVSAGT